MVHLYFVIAFVLLWAFLAAFLYLVVKIAHRIDTGEEDGPREHGL